MNPYNFSIYGGRDLDGDYLTDDILFPKYKRLRNVPHLKPKKDQPRNEKCKCGSGLKYKKCCGGVAYVAK